MTDSSKFEIPQSLQDAIISRNCVPFVGAGLSMTVLRKDNGKKLFCTWHDLLLEAAEKLKANNKEQAAKAIEARLSYIEEDSYLWAAKTAKKELSQHEFNAFLKQTFNKKQSEIQPPSLDTAKLVWQLNSQLVITTNYDKVLQWASTDTDVQSINIDAEFELNQLCKNNPTTNTVLHLHGSADNIGKIVLTPDGYQSLYGDEFTEAQHKAALRTLQNLLASKTFIFIGFSFADQTFYNQLKLINDIFDGNSPQHFVLCRENQKADIDRLDLPLETVCYKEYEDLPKLLSELSLIAQTAQQKPDITTDKTVKPHIQPQQASIQKPDLNNNVFFVPFRAKGKNVIGREQTLKDLREKLVNGQQTNIGHATGFKGMGGVGKTQLAIEYAYNYKDEYPKGVIWLTADQDINSQLIACAKEAKWVAPSIEDKDALVIAKRRLQSQSDSLIIFDNVEALEDIKPFLPNNNVNPHLLLTSRNFIEGFEILDLDSLKNDDALALLCNEAGKSLDDLTAQNAQQEFIAANKLCQQFGQLPLALEIAGAHIKRRSRYTFAKYLETFEQNFARATADVKLASFTKHEQCLISTLKLSDEIISEYPTLIKVMQILAYSANAAMGEDLLSFMLYGQKHQHLPDELDESLNIGDELNLITVSNENESTRYSLHRLVKRVQLELTPFADDLTWCQQLADNMVQWFKPIREQFEHLALFQLEQPHLEKWANYTAEQHWQQQPALIWLQTYPLWHLGHYQQAKNLLDQAQTALNKFKQLQNSALIADIFDDYGTVLSHLGDYQQSLKYGEKALNLRETLFGKNHEDVANSFNNLSSRYSNLGQYDQALKYCQKALEMRIAIFGEHHPGIATSYSNLSSSYSDLGQYNQTLKYCQKALEMRIAIFGEHHPKVATSYNNLSSCYSNLGQYNQALKYCQKALEMRIAIFGEHHPDVATSYSNLGGCYYQLNDNQTALTHLQKAFNLRLDLLGPQHPSTLFTFKNKQQTLTALKRFQPAMTAINDYRQQLPKSHAFQKELNEVEKYLKVKAVKNGFSLRKAGQNRPNKKSKKGKRR